MEDKVPIWNVINMGIRETETLTFYHYELSYDLQS